MFGNYGQDYRKQNGWGNKAKVEADIKCSLVGDSTTIYIECTPKHKIAMLMEEYPSREWIGYLTGGISEDGNTFFVEDVIIPPHESASMAEAIAKPFQRPDNCIGVIHSHNSMGAFHSGTDMSHVDKNFPISITVAKRYNATAMEMDAVSTKYTPCKKAIMVKCEVLYTDPEPTFDTEAFLKGAKTNVSLGVTVYPSFTRYWERDGQFAKKEFDLDKISKGEKKRMKRDFKKDGYVIAKGGHVLTEIELTELLRETRRPVGIDFGDDIEDGGAVEIIESKEFRDKLAY